MSPAATSHPLFSLSGQLGALIVALNAPPPELPP